MCHGGGPNPEKVGPRRVGPRRVRAQNFALFFSLSRHSFLFFFPSLLVFFVEFWWCLKRRDPQMCTFGVLRLSCASPGGPVWWGLEEKAHNLEFLFAPPPSLSPPFALLPPLHRRKCPKLTVAKVGAVAKTGRAHPTTLRGSGHDPPLRPHPPGGRFGPRFTRRYTADHPQQRFAVADEDSLTGQGLEEFAVATRAESCFQD